MNDFLKVRDLIVRKDIVPETRLFAASWGETISRACLVLWWVRFISDLKVGRIRLTQEGFILSSSSKKSASQIEVNRISCLNCGRLVSNAYCEKCGQKSNTARLTMEALLVQSVDALLHFTKRALHTLYELFFRPGQTIEAYLGGKRQDFQSPAATFTFGFLFVLGFAYVLEPALKSELVLEREVGTLTALGKPRVLLGMLAIAVFAHLFVGRSRLYLAETIAAFMYVYGLTFVIAGPIMLISASQWKSVHGTLQQYSYLAVDAPLLLFIVTQFWRVTRYMKLSLWGFTAAVVFGLVLFAAVRSYFDHS